MTYLPDEFVKTIKSVHKENGQTWLNHFEQLIKHCEEKWELKIQPPYELSYNFVAPAVRVDGSKVVVKLVVPGDEGFQNEVEALKHFNGQGIIRLLYEEAEKGIMILEHVSPGDKLASIENDDEATLIMAQVMKKLWKSPPNNTSIQTLFQREKDFQNIRLNHKDGVGPITKTMLMEAEEIFSRLTSTMKDLYLLHGDFHHYNVLSVNQKDWIVIDPKGLIGEREYDVIQFLLNKLPDDQVEQLIEKRINILVEHLHLNKERILLWGYCHSILSLYWDIEDFGVPNEKTFEVITSFKNLYSKIYGV
ncbi:aminoglycoside phosphotransferase family protein [uncultured Metabacillus sp.]|uniref:aminoglycoside phosphotransferase family protein n=1 Tax=uncultured Metabacillus sp. TaxID=2860135 RepID=UPI00262B75EB|nr:aminoglycoside phosphotransferase family protein [uncultured Metabacillus sp.]